MGGAPFPFFGRTPMLNTPRSEMSFAYDGRSEIRLAANTKCPHCGRCLHATDVEADFGGVRLICIGCHRDVLIIRSAS
jgi:hypothetical protein